MLLGLLYYSRILTIKVKLQLFYFNEKLRHQVEVTKLVWQTV
jgi:hypothetical protein